MGGVGDDVAPSSSLTSSPPAPSLPPRSPLVSLLDGSCLWFSYLARLSVTVGRQASSPAVHWVSCSGGGGGSGGSGGSPLPTLRVSEALSYGELWHSAVLVAAHLRSQCGVQAGERVLLCFPFTSLDFIVAFLACLLHGCVPCPCYPPDPTRFAATVPTLARLQRNVQARHALTNSQYARWRRLSALQPRVRWPQDLAFVDCEPVRHRARDDYRKHEAEYVRLHRKLFTADAFTVAGSQRHASSDDAGESKLPAAVVDAYTCALRQVQASVREPTSLAFIQQTSGSTADPKGVMVHHLALNDNIGHTTLINRLTQHIDRDAGRVDHIDARMFSWLPMYHDLGLVYAYLLPLHLGGAVWTMSPLDFIKSPLSWVAGMSQFGATMSGAPNFAWDLVVRRWTALPVHQRPALQLSQMRLLTNGAEVVHAVSLSDFTRAFASSGFDEAAACCVYGMAEHVVSLTYERSHTVVLNTRTPHLVSCGSDFGDHDTAVMIVHTSGGEEEAEAEAEVRVCADNEVGHIWVCGFSAAAGYWNDPTRTRSTFHNTAPASAPPHLRFHTDGVTPRKWLATGDLGCLEDGHLYITGRSKELIILRGRNLYPADLERSLYDMPELRRGCCVALGLTADEAVHSWQQRCKRTGSKRAAQRGDGNELASLRTEQLVVLVELREERKQSRAELSAIARRIVECVSAEHGQQLGLLCLFRPKTLPKTTSGKLRRVTAREQCVDFTFAQPPLCVIDQSDVSKDKARAATADMDVVDGILQPAANKKSIAHTVASAAPSLPPWDPSADCAERERAILSVIVLLVAEHSTSAAPLQLIADPTADCLWGECGIDSMHSVLMLSDVQRWLSTPCPGATQPTEYEQVSLSPSLLFDYPSFRQLARYLARLDQDGDSMKGTDTADSQTDESDTGTRGGAVVAISIAAADDEYTGSVGKEASTAVTGAATDTTARKPTCAVEFKPHAAYAAYTLEADKPVSTARYVWCGVAQMLALSCFWAWFLLATSYAFHLLSLLSSHLSAVALLACVPLLFVAEGVALSLSVVLVKWLLLGRVRPGRYRAWGGFFLRWWVVHTYSAWLHMLFLHVLRNTWMYRCWLAAMGMQGAFRCALLDSVHLSTVDMISMHGDGVIVEGEVVVSPHCLHGQHLVIQRVHIEARAHLSHRCVVQTTVTGANVGGLPAPTVIAAGTVVRATEAQPLSHAHPHCAQSMPSAQRTTHAVLKAAAEVCQLYGHCLLVVLASCVVYEVVLRVASAWALLPSELAAAALGWSGGALGAGRAYVSVIFLLGPHWLVPFVFWLARPELGPLSALLQASSLFSWFQHTLLLSHYVLQLVFLITLAYLVFLLSTAALLILLRRVVAPITGALHRAVPRAAPMLQLLDGVQQGVFDSSIRQWTLLQCFVWTGTAGQVWMQRALGARIGSQVVVADTVTWTHPERIRVEDRAFIGDLSSLQPVSYDGGAAPHLNDIHVGRAALVGMRATVQNRADALATCEGIKLIDNGLLGAGTLFDGDAQQAVDRVIRAQRSKQSVVVFGKHVTSTSAGAPIEAWPLWFRCVYASAWPVIVSTVQLFCTVLTLLPTATASVALLSRLGYWPAFGVHAALVWLLWASALAWLVLCKWLLMGRFTASTHSLASAYFLRRLVYVHALGFMRCCGLDLWQCTALLPAVYRLLGAHIGGRCLLQCSNIVETDLLRLGERAAVNAHAVLFGHVVERGALSTAQLTVGDDCTLDAACVALCGSSMADSTHLLPQTVVMKGQTLANTSRAAEQAGQTGREGSGGSRVEHYSGTPAVRVTRMKL